MIRSRKIAAIVACAVFFSVVQPVFAEARTWGDVATEGAIGSVVGGVAGALIGGAVIFFTGGAGLPLVVALGASAAGGAAVGGVYGAGNETVRNHIAATAAGLAVTGAITATAGAVLPAAGAGIITGALAGAR